MCWCGDTLVGCAGMIMYTHTHTHSQLEVFGQLVLKQPEEGGADVLFGAEFFEAKANEKVNMLSFTQAEFDTFVENGSLTRFTLDDALRWKHEESTDRIALQRTASKRRVNGPHHFKTDRITFLAAQAYLQAESMTREYAGQHTYAHSHPCIHVLADSYCVFSNSHIILVNAHLRVQIIPAYTANPCAQRGSARRLTAGASFARRVETVQAATLNSCMICRVP
jgi:hypothetical protein